MSSRCCPIRCNAVASSSDLGRKPKTRSSSRYGTRWAARSGSSAEHPGGAHVAANLPRSRSQFRRDRYGRCVTATATPFFGSDLPIVAAPMAGGPSTTALVAAAAKAGAFGFVAGGYKAPDALNTEMAELRRRNVLFGVNLFVPNPSDITEAEYRRYARELAQEGEPYGLDLAAAPLVVQDDDQWQAKVDVLLASPPLVVSFTFGLPEPAALHALQAAGSIVLATVTTLGEARAAEEIGVDGLVVQGSRAGGHSATFDPRRPIVEAPTGDLVRAFASESKLPMIAAGGITSSVEARTLLDAGAVGVAVGTLLLRTDESGASQTHKDALVAPEFNETVITHAFTGRPARALRNGFIDRHEQSAPFGYPALHHLTRPLRAAAAAAGRPDEVHLWAGTGFRAARPGPAAGAVAALAADLG